MPAFNDGWLGVPALGALASAFALAREWRGSIAPGMIAHAMLGPGRWFCGSSMICVQGTAHGSREPSVALTRAMQFLGCPFT